MPLPSLNEVIRVTARYREAKHGKVDVVAIERAILQRIAELPASQDEPDDEYRNVIIDIMEDEFNRAPRIDA